MTDNPEVVATADLTPESPKPINLSSPIAVPALQDQADSLSTMALSPSEDMPDTTISQTAEILSETGNIEDQVEANVAASPSDASFAIADASNSNEGAKELNAILKADSEDEDDYAKDFDSPVAGPADAIEDSATAADGNIFTNDVPKTESSPKSSDLPQLEDITTLASQPTPNSVSGPVLQSATEAAQSAAPAAVTQIAPEDVSTVEESVPPQAKAADAIDIQALVDNITARHAASDAAEHVVPEPNGTAIGAPSTANPQSSLPPKPPASQQPAAANLRPEELHRFQPNVPTGIPNLTPAAALPYSYPPGTTTPTGYAPQHMYPNPGPPMPLAAPYSAAQVPGVNDQSSQRYDDFLKEERKYVSEAKWDRFPEGSRLFIGNLSSERVSKKEVFDIFSHYGRLAQISLKQAYGFVQYHTVSEGQAAMDALQGMEISGRKIHLEFSRAQKKESDSDRRGNRGGRAGGNQSERGDRGDRNRFEGRRGDGYRPRSPSPSRGNHSRQGSYGRGDRGQWDQPSDYTRRGRSRSPTSFGGGVYRRRSPSPYRRGPPTSEADLDIPRRYGSDVPDLQLLLLQDVNRDFVSWVQGAFVERGLRVDVMFLNPRFPRELVIQRQVVEGVHGVTELDFRSQTVAKIPLQTFDRSAGRHNARFDQYQDLDPKIAAEIVARAKSQSHLQSPAGYGNGQYPPVNYPLQPQMPPQSYPGIVGQQPANLNLGGLDNATLQRVLSAVQGGSQGGIPGQSQMGAAPNVDVNAVLSVLGASGAAPAPIQQQPIGYPSAPPSGNPADQAHVQDIMAQLSRYRH